MTVYINLYSHNTMIVIIIIIIVVYYRLSNEIIGAYIRN